MTNQLSLICNNGPIKSDSLFLKKIIASILFSTCILFFSNCKAQSTANFSSDIISGCAPIVVNFKDQSTGHPTEWKWDLGNGTTSNLQNPSNTYFTPGHYTVRLIIKTGNEKDTIVKTNYIIVHGSPIANLSANVTTGCSPLAVTFSDIPNTVNGETSLRQWDLGDGALSTLATPTHTYLLAGNYNITLKVTNIYGCTSTFRKDNYIHNNYIKAGLITKVENTCSPNKITFQNTTKANGTITTAWNFGDNTTASTNNITHTYRTGGVYIVKMTVRNSFGCIDSLIQELHVSYPVSASFYGDNIENCRGPVNVQFTNQELTGNKYFWDFGDSSFSSAPNPIHQFNDTGNYTVNLIVKNINGCVDTLKRSKYIKIYKPLFEMNDLPDSGCAPFTKTFSVTTNKDNPIVNYFWDFGDGSTSALYAPTHVYTKLGYYTVGLICTGANGCKDTIKILNAIRVSSLPTVSFYSDMKIGCAKTTVHFTNNSTGATAWEWDFGQMIGSTEKNPKYDYSDTGWMPVTLIAKNGGCYNTTTYKKYIYIKPAVAKFSGTMVCDLPMVRNFINLSRGATRYLWNFGDGITSVEFSPVHTFASAGNYDVTLYVWNDSTGCDHSITKKIKILKVIPSFTASETVACRNAVINFSSILDTADVSRFTWDFGDGTILRTRTNQTSHIYTKNGTYSVTLITSSILNCADTIVKAMYIKINGPGAKFGAVENIVCVNKAAMFIDSSSAEINSINTWIWKYADGLIDTTISPSSQHSFKTAGNYPVFLKLIDKQGCTDTATISAFINIIKLNAKFSASDTIACPGYPITFTCPYSIPGLSYAWDFGDGSTSTLKTPSHIYKNKGSYSVKLHLTHLNGCEDSIKIINFIKIAQTVAVFEMSDSFSVCPPLLVKFTNRSVNAINEYWDFGDSTFTDLHNPSHFYIYLGVYTITLYAKGPGGCTATMHRTITIKGPKGTLSYDPLKQCKPYTVNFNIHSTDVKTFLWDFNDGNIITNNDSVINHVYSDSGKFIPKIILVDTMGCRVPVTGKDTITNIFATANFYFPDNVLCTGSDILFTNTSYTNDIKPTYYWSFGDDTHSTQKDPVHQYSAPGFYRSAQPVKVVPSSNVRIGSSTKGCAPFTTTFFPIEDETGASFIQWHWDMDNGNVYDVQNPPLQVYTQAGTYIINLDVVNANGCFKTVKQKIDVYPVPVMNMPNDTLLYKGQQVSLQASGADKYKWEPSEEFNCDTCGTVLAKPSISKKYIVTGSTSQGCTASASISIKVKQPFKITYTQPATVCLGETKKLEAAGASVYQWSPSNDVNQSIMVKPDTTTDYRVIGMDDAGCFKDTGYVKLTVYPIPTVNAGGNRTMNIGQSITIKPVISSDVTSVTWTPQTNVISSRNDLPDLTVKPKTKTEYTVEVKNNGGCKATDNVTVFVICDGTNVFMPNTFSPNNDGVNDVFYPRGTGLYKIKGLRIFNRWGQIVFEKNNFNSNDASAAWDGTYKGTKLNADNFIYTMQVQCDNNASIDVNGTIYLMK